MKRNKFNTYVNCEDGDFIKLYVKDLCQLYDLTPKEYNVLFELIKLMNDKNEVILVPNIKSEICLRANVKSSDSLNNILSSLTKSCLINRLGIGLYKINPYLFAKNTGKNVIALRTEFIYTGNGRSMKVTHITDESEIPKILI